jgi:cation:H+ antiporter
MPDVILNLFYTFPAQIVIFAIGVGILLGGGEMLVTGSSNIARILRINSIIIGMVVIGFGTSMPEVAVGVLSSYRGHGDIALANSLGSNVCNLALVLGITAIIAEYRVSKFGKHIFRIDVPIFLAAQVILCLVAYRFSDITAAITGDASLIVPRALTFRIGLFFTLLFIVLNIYLIFRAIREQPDNVKAADFPHPSQYSTKQRVIRAVVKNGIYICIGIAALIFGAQLLVKSGVFIASSLGVSERIIGLTLFALGTSLPELIAASIAAVRREHELALGNILGSNVFNILLVLGLASMVREIPIQSAFLQFDILFNLGLSLLVALFLFTKLRLQRWEGVVLLIFYFAYIAFVTTIWPSVFNQ